jgi:hypothetical protein
VAPSELVRTLDAIVVDVTKPDPAD